MIVHFIGNAGSGKSTVWKLTAAKGGFNVLAQKTPRQILSSAAWLARLTYPMSYRLGHRLAVHNRESTKGPGRRRWARTIAKQKAQRWTLPRVHVYLVDEGMTNLLRKYLRDSAVNLISELPLPDMVIHVNAPKAVKLGRVALRQRLSDTPSHYLAGERALDVGVSLARQWSALWGRDEAMRCLWGWNRIYCRPELPEGELERLLDVALASSQTDDDEAALRCEPLPEQLRWLHDSCVAQGVHWLNIVNDGRYPAKAHATRIVEKIRSFRGSCG